MRTALGTRGAPLPMDEGDAEAFVERIGRRIEFEAWAHNVPVYFAEPPDTGAQIDPPDPESEISQWEVSADMMQARAQPQGRRRREQEPWQHIFHAEATGWRWTWFPGGWAANHFWRDGRLTGLWVFTFRSNAILKMQVGAAAVG